MVTWVADTLWHFLIPDRSRLPTDHARACGKQVAPPSVLVIWALPSCLHWHPDDCDDCRRSGNWNGWSDVYTSLGYNWLTWEASNTKQNFKNLKTLPKGHSTQDTHIQCCCVQMKKMRRTQHPYSWTRHQSKLKIMVMAVAERAEDHFTTVLYTIRQNTSQYSQNKMGTKWCRMVHRYLRLQSLSGASQEESKPRNGVMCTSCTTWVRQMKQRRTKQTTCNLVGQSMTSRCGLLFFIYFIHCFLFQLLPFHHVDHCNHRWIFFSFIHMLTYSAHS